MDGKKENFLRSLKSAGGIISTACDSVGITRTTYYNWRRADDEFSTSVDEIMEMQIDFVESKLMQLINAGDTTATIFYLKTKGKNRGYTERITPGNPIPTTTTQNALTSSQSDKKDTRKDISKQIKNKKDYIIKILKEQGKYTAELSMQVTIAARLLVRADILSDEIFDERHSNVNVEYSREGNERQIISPKEKLFLEISKQSQAALQALGMNTDAKDRKVENDGFGEFIKTFRDEN